MVNIEIAGFRKGGGLPRYFRPYTYLQWGPWYYCARPLVYTFSTNNPARLIHVEAGNTYYEKMAFVPIKIDDVKSSFEYLERLYDRLCNPLEITIVEDTDPRAPKLWLPPILVEEFEEMEED